MFRSASRIQLLLTLMATASACTAAQAEMVVSSSSMLPVFKKGEPVACDEQKPATYALGDIIAYRHPKKPDKTWIKMVAGLGGDEVQVRNQMLMINGKAVAKTPKGPFELTESDGKKGTAARFEETLPNGVKTLVIHADAGAFGNFMPSVKVPDGSVFVLGNNRDFSIDSRDTRAHGTVPESNIICKVTSKASG